MELKEQDNNLYDTQRSFPNKKIIYMESIFQTSKVSLTFINNVHLTLRGKTLNTYQNDF